MFKKLKIGTKLVSGFIIVAIIAAFIGLLGIINIRKIDSRDTMMYRKMTVPMSYIAGAVEHFHRMRADIMKMLLARNVNEYNVSIEKIYSNEKKIGDYLGKFAKLMISQHIKNVYSGLPMLRKQYQKHIKQMIALKKQDKVNQAIEIANGEAYQVALKEQNILDKLVKIKIDDAQELSIENSAVANTTTVVMIVITVLGFIIAVFLGVFLSRSISQPLIVGVDFAKSIADKDLTMKLDEKYTGRGDEIGILSRALDEMHKNLIDIVLQLNDVANNLAAGSEEIAASAQNMAEGAQSQAASVEETSASMEELSSAVVQVSDNADNVNNKEKELLETAQSSSELIGQAVTSMDKISESSTMISEILSVINDIADQTNLLALNAAIEAARAGEHGRGFAVVADEISKLADKSTENSKEIEKLIKQSIKDIDGGTGIVKNAGDAFGKIITEINSNGKLIDEISKAALQQKTGAEQVQNAIENINEITQNSSASAEEMAASTEELQSQAENITRIIGQFKIAGENGNKKQALEFNSHAVLNDKTQNNNQNTVKKQEQVKKEVKKVAVYDEDGGGE